MTVEDVILKIRTAPNRLSDVYRAYVTQAKAVEQNDLIWPQGRLNEVNRLRQEAVDTARQIGETVAVASDVAKKALQADRDKLRPKVDNATHERKARQLSYLVDRGVPLQELISENVTDAVTLRILEDELPVLARGQQPDYRDSGQTYDELLHQAARNVYGDDFRAADDRLAEVDRGAYRANVAAAQTVRQLRDDDRGGLTVPAFTEGQLIEV